MFKSIRESLARTRQSIFGQIVNVLGAGEIDDETWEDVEALLIQADVGVPTTMALVEAMRERVARDGLYRSEQLVQALKDEIRAIITDAPPFELEAPRQLTVAMVVGVNGSGKTTSIGKLAHRYAQAGRKVMLAAGDTFRAAAIDQLQIWGERANVPVIAGQPGSDPAAVTYDGIRAARARGYDLLIVDTAGRLHTKFNLMKELEKVYGVCKKSVHGAPHEVLLVLDAPTG
ncbi:MAG: signal recognition particle-docking protein FtsY, partial [Candidatus Thermofonsia bacterium]